MTIERARWILHEWLYDHDASYKRYIWNEVLKLTGRESGDGWGKICVENGTLDNYICAHILLS